jgi:hypothetical protein
MSAFSSTATPIILVIPISSLLAALKGLRYASFGRATRRLDDGGRRNRVEPWPR